MTSLPPVTAEVAAAALESLPTRLRKRADSAAAKAANWPVTATDATVVVRVDDATTVTLTTTAGVVTSAEDAVCSCLLAPACLHRAAVLTLAPLAEETDGPETTAVVPSDADDSTPVPPPVPPETGALRLTLPQSAAVHALRAAATAVLAAGVSGSGAVHRATLLHGAHSARVAGLHRAAAAAVRVARRLSEAGTGDPAFRLPELASELAELLTVADGLGRAPDPDLIGTARRAYVANGSLRLRGLFTEPVVTASGYAGAVTYALAQDGRLRSLSDVAPGDADRARQAAGSAVPGGSALTLRELGDHGGAILTDPTVSPDGRIGGGGAVRSVQASGARWHEEPLDTLWRRSPADQVAAALRWSAEPAEERDAGGDLLFLTGTITGGGFAVDGGPTVRLLAPDERPELPYVENLRLLAGAHGLSMRLVARLAADRPSGVRALAAAWQGADGDPIRADLGLRRLNRTHLPRAGRAVIPSTPAPTLPTELDLLRRAVDRAVAGGRAVTAAVADGELPRRLATVGLTTGAACARALVDTASDRRHDALGRLRPADPEAYARAWLASSTYASAATASLLTAAWAPEGDRDPA
ncbi:hypothetical protein SMIR_35050 [Streptomyces mirabilis]|uniref:hypothetical protein n=1 Tax=Streptomyces mirabilis TaxID=68239 RepID=UPI00143E5E7C|nr:MULTISPECIES: hypothetical protein [Streptomyces]QIY69418.1 hypothetical protein HEP84_09730 [Streptomyces sp. RLB1-33]QUW83735.1 hypothetical protein SMIR_35050 [Streptomyces mirabilis]